MRYHSRQEIEYDDIKITYKDNGKECYIYYFEIYNLHILNLNASPIIQIYCQNTSPFSIIYPKDDFDTFQKDFNYFIDSMLED